MNTDWIVSITGTDPAFCAGMDLTEARAALARFSNPHVGTVWPETQRGEQMIDQVYHCPRPTPAAIHGIAAGNGAGLNSACDIASMASTAHIGHLEMRSEIQASMVVLHLLRLVGERVSRHLLLAGEALDGEARQELEAFSSHQRPPWAAAQPGPTRTSTGPK